MFIVKILLHAYTTARTPLMCLFGDCRSRRALSDSVSEIRETISRMKNSYLIDSMSHFSQRVIFAKPSDDDAIRSLRQIAGILYYKFT